MLYEAIIQAINTMPNVNLQKIWRIAALRSVNEIKNLLCNTICTLPVILNEIKIKVQVDPFIRGKKKQAGN